MLKVNSKIEIPLKEFDFSFARSPGPGGQNVNKVNTKVVLKWPIVSTTSIPDDVKERFLKKYARRISKTGELVITSHRFRDQGRNVADALSKLRELIESVAIAPVKRKITKPSRRAKARRVEAKRRKSATKKNRKPPKMND